MMRTERWRAGAGALLLAAALAPAAAAQAPERGRVLSLEEALARAGAASEGVRIAEAGVLRSHGERMQARSARFPQLSGTASYSRTLASQFSGLGSPGGGPPVGPPRPPCERLVADPALPLAERVAGLERAVACDGDGFGGLDFSRLGFGSPNTYSFGLQLSQSLFDGGRTGAQQRIAGTARTVAESELASARAQAALDVTQAYLDARLADRMTEIAEATLAQAEEALRLVEAATRAGNQAEFDALRARVARDNARPAVIARRAEREIAYVRLRQLAELPDDEPLALSTPLEAPLPAGLATPGDTAVAAHVAVRQAEGAVEVQRGQLRIVRSQRLPGVNLISQLGRVGYSDAVVPAWNDFATNWTVGVSVQMPLLTGGRLRGEEVAAEAGVAESRARLARVRQLAALDARSAVAAAAAADAILEASAGTVEQAERAYEIAALRFREGISTQLELSDARLMLQQARANRAQAARDAQIARVRLALLPELPLGAGGGAAPAQTGGAPGGAPASGPTTPAQAGPRGGAGGAPGGMPPTTGIPGAGAP